MEPVNVQCVKGRNSQTFYYNVEGITEASWEIVPQNGEHVGKFRATAGGRTYGHTSDPFPDKIRDQMGNVSKKKTKKDFQVTVNSNNPVIRDYFRC